MRPCLSQAGRFLVWRGLPATLCSQNALFLVVSPMALFEYGHTKKSLTGQLLWFVFWGVLTGIGAYLTPDKSGHGTHQQLGLPPCPSVLFFDRPCPGCGLTTSWTALIHGHFSEAFHAHPLGPFMYLFYTATAFMALYGYIRGAQFVTDCKPFALVTNTAIGIFLVFGLTRMILTPHFGTKSEHLISVLNRALH